MEFDADQLEKIRNGELTRKPRIGNSTPRNEIEVDNSITESELLSGLSNTEGIKDVDASPKEVTKRRGRPMGSPNKKNSSNGKESRSDVFEPINNDFKEGLIVDNPLAQYMNDFLNEMGKQGYTLEDYFNIQMEKYGQPRSIVRNGIYRLINKGELSFPKFIQTVEGFGYTLNIQIKYNPDADHPVPSKEPSAKERKDTVIDESIDEYLKKLDNIDN